MKKTTTFILIVLLVLCCCLSIVKAEVTAYMWQENNLNPDIFGFIQDQNNPQLCAVSFEPHRYRDAIRISVVHLTNDYFDIVYTSPVLDPGEQNAFPIILAYTNGTYLIQFESVFTKADGKVDENRPVYILHEINLDGATLRVIPSSLRADYYSSDPGALIKKECLLFSCSFS